MLTLEQLASDWLAPQREEDFALPTLTNFRGCLQASWSASGIQNWSAPPTALPTPTAALYYRDGERIRRFDRRATYRWRAYEIERAAGGVSTTLRMSATRPGIMERMRFERPMTAYLVFGGLPRVWRFTDYWNLPPEDVPMFNVRRTRRGFLLTDTKTFGAAEFFLTADGCTAAAPGCTAAAPGEVMEPAEGGRATGEGGRGTAVELNVYDDLVAWLDGEPPCEAGKIGVAEIHVSAGDEIVWHAVQGCDELEPLDVEAEWDSNRLQWERVWQAAFTPGNAEFGGHLPDVGGGLQRLYAMSVLSLLMTRRFGPRLTPRGRTATGGQAIWSEGKEPLEVAYVWGGPEGAPTTSFLWEMEFQAGLLARLDPAVLRQQLEAMIEVDLHRHWGIETVSGAGAGMGYGVNAGAFLSCVSDYVRITGDRAWALRRLDYLKSCLRPELTDYGECQNILECVSSYEHTIAAFNASAVAGLRFMAELTGERSYRAQADALAQQVLALYAGGPFACIQPDGGRRVVKTILDFIYVGRHMTADLPAEMKRGMVRFFEQELQTEDWLYALSPRDANALTRDLPAFQTYRADHQATGAYDGWPARAASVLLRFGEREKAEAWLHRIQRLTHEGPFGQAHQIFKDGARKASFYNGNGYLGGCGSAYAVTLLDDMTPPP